MYGTFIPLSDKDPSLTTMQAKRELDAASPSLEDVLEIFKLIYKNDDQASLLN